MKSTWSPFARFISPTLTVSLLAGLALAPAAGAAEVSAAALPPNLKLATGGAELDFRAAPGETNQLTIREIGGSGETMRLEVVDLGASTSTSGLCSGGGAPGVPVICEVPATKYADLRPDGSSDPATERVALINVLLADGDDSFDGGSSPWALDERVRMQVQGGEGSDRIVTGGGYDAIEPGAGSDEVHAGGGRNEIAAGATPDGADVFDLGSGGGEVNYAERTTPVILDGGIAGAPGEGDTILGTGYVSVLGGAAADVMSTGESVNQVSGSGGDDVLVGSSQADRLLGDDGDDRLFGRGGGDDLSGGEGNDVIRAGRGPDEVSGFNGDDLLFGERGADKIVGESGADRIFGNAGRDSISGGSGQDRLSGQDGNDILDGGPGLDRLACGRGRDGAVRSTRDHRTNCEVVLTPPTYERRVRS